MPSHGGAVRGARACVQRAPDASEKVPDCSWRCAPQEAEPPKTPVADLEEAALFVLAETKNSLTQCTLWVREGP